MAARFVVDPPTTEATQFVTFDERMREMFGNHPRNPAIDMYDDMPSLTPRMPAAADHPQN